MAATKPISTQLSSQASTRLYTYTEVFELPGEPVHTVLRVQIRVAGDVFGGNYAGIEVWTESGWREVHTLHPNLMTAKYRPVMLEKEFAEARDDLWWVAARVLGLSS